MITKKSSTKMSKGKYLLFIPALLACGIFMATAKSKTDAQPASNEWTYEGNTFTARYTDTLSYDESKKQVELAKIGSGKKKQVISTLNGETVYQNEYLDTKASFGFSTSAYMDYIKKEFAALRKNTPDSMAFVTELSLVVDKYGKVVYYSAKYQRAKPQFAKEPVTLYPYGNPEPALNEFMKKIITSSPLWKPAMLNGNAVNSFINVEIPGC